MNHIVWKPEVQNWHVVSENLPSIISRYACGLVLFDVVGMGEVFRPGLVMRFYLRV